MGGSSAGWNPALAGGWQAPHVPRQRGGIKIIPVSGGPARYLTETGDSPQWSPNGRTLLIREFSPNVNPVTEMTPPDSGGAILALIDAGGGPAAALTNKDNSRSQILRRRAGSPMAAMLYFIRCLRARGPAYGLPIPNPAGYKSSMSARGRGFPSSHRTAGICISRTKPQKWLEYGTPEPAGTGGSRARSL